jgi:hypothetical protein
MMRLLQRFPNFIDFEPIEIIFNTKEDLLASDLFRFHAEHPHFVKFVQQENTFGWNLRGARLDPSNEWSARGPGMKPTTIIHAVYNDGKKVFFAGVEDPIDYFEVV